MQPISSNTTTSQATLRRRNLDNGYSNGSSSYMDHSSTVDEDSKYFKPKVRNLDFFPKVERDYTVKTEHGGFISVIGYGIMTILVLSEILSWLGFNQSTVENVIVDTSLGKRMQVNINITFPALACEDLHLDVMDSAGDSQFNIEDTLLKRRLDLAGNLMSSDVMGERANRAKTEQDERKKYENQAKDPDYCGPCYGARDIGECCQTCEDVIKAYKAKRWSSDMLLGVAEQCIREGKAERKPKKMKKGEGCNLSGYMTINRVNGNFHIAMGEGVERDGRHIHQFLPEDTPNFNASHIIHELSFGPKVSNKKNVLDGVKKYTTEENGTTGLFQYFIKIVPTKYKNKGETNRFFYTERFRPLMKHLVEDSHYDLGSKKSDNKNWGFGSNKVAGHTHDHKEHHSIMNSILPGVFFIYEIYPFEVEVSNVQVTFTHLMIRIMALVGGIYTLLGFIDSFLYSKDKKKNSFRNGF